MKLDVKVYVMIATLLFAGASQPLPAQEHPLPLQLEITLDSVIALAEHTAILADPSRVVNWQQADSLYQSGAFTPLKNFRWPANRQRARFAYWTVVDLITGDSFPQQELIFKPEVQDSLSLILLQDDRQIQETLAGHYHQSSGTLRWVGGYLNKTDVSIALSGGHHYRLLVRTAGELGYSIRTNPQLTSISTRSEEIHRSSIPYFLFFGLFFGVLLFIFVFSLVQYAQHRDHAFLWYSLYLAGIVIFYLRNFSFNEYLVVLPPPSMAYRWFMLFVLPMAIGYLGFVNSFLITRSLYPQFYRYSRWLAIGIGCFALSLTLIAQFDRFVAWDIQFYGRIIFGLLASYLLYFLFRRRNDALVVYVLLGTAILIVSSLSAQLLGSFLSNHHLGSWNITDLPGYFGILLEVLFFAAGLGYKTRLAETQRMQAKAEADRLRTQQLFHSRLLANVSHEFRTPLTLIMGQARQLKGQQGIGKLILQQARQLLRLVDQLLDLTRAEKGLVKMNWVQGDVMPFLNYLTNSFQSVAVDKHISLAFFKETEELVIDYEPQKLQRIMNNLLSNAIKFTPDYGQVKVIAGSSGSDQSGYLRLRIEDSGRGIAPEVLPHIFERFYRADESNTTNTEGMGIGLSLVKTWVDLLDAKITVESTLEQGTRFTLLFPIHHEAPLQEANILPVYAQTRQSSTRSLITKVQAEGTANAPLLLLVEDNYEMLKYLASLLTPAYQLLRARNGREGLDKAIVHQPDLIISDVMMPEMDGWTLCAHLKSQESTLAIPIVLLTARAGLEDRIHGLQAGSDAYLAKPFSEEELQLTIRMLLAKRHQLVDPSKEKVDKKASWLEKVAAILSDHLEDEDFRPDHLAQCLQMSRSQLHRKLKKHTGQSTAEYIRLFRLQKARRLLLTTDDPVSEIAYAVGFSNLSWFSQAYRNAFNEPPSATRK